MPCTTAHPGKGCTADAKFPRFFSEHVPAGSARRSPRAPRRRPCAHRAGLKISTSTGPAVAGRVDCSPQSPQVDAAVAELAAAQQHPFGQRGHPVGELEAGDPAALPRPGDPRGRAVVPPQVVGVHDDSDLLGREAARRCPGPGREWRPRTGPRRTSGAAARSPAAPPARPRRAPGSRPPRRPAPGRRRCRGRPRAGRRRPAPGCRCPAPRPRRSPHGCRPGRRRGPPGPRR